MVFYVDSYISRGVSLLLEIPDLEQSVVLSNISNVSNIGYFLPQVIFHTHTDYATALGGHP